MHTTNYLAGGSKVSFSNNAIEHPGKGMKPRHIPTKVWLGADIGDFNHGCSKDPNSSIRWWVYLSFGDKYMYYYVKHFEIEHRPKTSNLFVDKYSGLMRGNTVGLEGKLLVEFQGFLCQIVE